MTKTSDGPIGIGYTSRTLDRDSDFFGDGAFGGLNEEGAYKPKI